MKALGHRLPFDGDLLFNGKSKSTWTQEGVDIHKMVRYLEQTDSHLATFTVRESIDFAHRVSSKVYSAERVEEVIQQLGLQECADTILGDVTVKGVSGGQKRRVSIGEILASDARVLLLDEPTNGLDTATSEDIFRHLRAWCSKQQTSLVCT